MPGAPRDDAVAAAAAGRRRLDAWAARLRAAASGATSGRALDADGLLDVDCVWRDLLLLTWNLQTLHAAASIGPALSAALAERGLAELRAPEEGARAPLGDVEVNDEDGTVDGWFLMETNVARGVARFTLRRASDGTDRCTALFTSMTELKGHEEAIGFRRPLGHELRAVSKRSGTAAGTNGGAAGTRVAPEPYVLVVGGSQSGLMLASRLKRLGVPALMVDRLSHPGDTWRNRYGSLHLHDAYWLNHFPYLPLPDHWPVFASKDLFADWLDHYAKIMDIDFQGNTEVVNAAFDSERQTWTVKMRKDGHETELRATHLVMAIGNCTAAKAPHFPGLETFRGTAVHSAHFRGCSPEPGAWAGRRCVVVGSNTSAHDIAQDLQEHGANVTMLQRSPTCVLRTERMRELAAMAGYSEEACAAGRDAACADLCGASVPFALKAPAMRQWVKELRQRDAEYYARLEKVGWKQDWGEDETGPYMMFIRAFRGYYFDIGASELVMDGKVKLCSDTEIAEVRPESVVLSSGEELPCELLISATGYENPVTVVSKLISPEVAKAVGPCWGYGSGKAGDPGPYEGEMRNMWKPTAQPNLWFQGGNIQMCRFYSLHLALQLKARFEGIVKPGSASFPTPAAMKGA